jgi:ketosteroid isomerase-like protein
VASGRAGWFSDDGELRLHPQEFVDAGDRVATRLLHSGRGKESGVEIDEEMFHQAATFRDGRIARMEYFADWGQALESAGVGERARDSSGPVSRAVDAPEPR